MSVFNSIFGRPAGKADSPDSFDVDSMLSQVSLDQLPSGNSGDIPRPIERMKDGVNSKLHAVHRLG